MEKKLFYIANIRMPTERAHGIQIAEMCQAFASRGYDVELVATNRKTDITKDAFDFYDIPKCFKITKLWCLDWVKYGRFGFWLQLLSFVVSVTIYVLPKQGIFHTREEMLAVALKLMGKKVTWETHLGRTNIFTSLIKWLKIPIVVITEGGREVYLQAGIPADRVLVAADGADISRFDNGMSQHDARAQLGLPQDKKIILYKGGLIPWKGAGTLAEAIEHSKTPDTLFVFIGGNPQDVENFKKDYGAIPNISIRGNRPRQETPIYQKAADILVIPNSAKDDVSKLFTSPMKLFAYMAAGVPIVASDLQSLKEVLGKQDACFFTPDDPKSLATTLDHVFAHLPDAQKKAESALLKVREYSWEKRADSILAFIKA